MQNNKLFSNYILNVKIKNEYKELSADEVIDFKKICQRWNEAKGLENEIQHQHNFLQDFFCKILGYTGETGNEENTLWWESGTNDGRRPDGILGFNLKGYKDKDITKGDNINDGDIRVVIELKGADVNLDRNQNRKGLTITPVEQGFLYAPKVGGKCEWVIISNFKEIRLYKSTEANKYHSFTISELASDDSKIKEFHFLLAKGRLFTKDKNKSFVHFLNSDDSGESIENIFYSYYYDLRLEAWEAIYQTNNTTHTYGKNFYLYKAQKLIDRIIFIRFCKEKGALDGDAVLEALNNKFIKGKYNRLKALFTAMNEGNTELGISKFNGGLFAEDKDLDCLVVDDEIIERLVDFYSHDFGSELDVNILGHIFEQSISDLETLTGDNQAKRKKDGVFYTPAYISDYLVHDTINLWVNDKRKALGIKPKPEVKPQDFIDEKEWIRLQSLGVLSVSRDEYLKQRAIELKGYVEEQELSVVIYPTSKKHKELQEEKKQEAIKIKAWQDYAEALKTIKVLDPSCGSGAFLVKVFDYLQNEWKEVEKHIKTDKTDYTYKDILKNNIYGVDLNPVSAGITKLSLWLKTAHHKEPLTSLDKNIKVGNSLIDNPDIAGYYSEFEGKVIQEAIERDIFNQEELDSLTKEGLKKSLAFNWQEEFESVFKPEGVILGYNDPKTQAKIGFDIILGNPPYVRQELFKDIKTELEAKYQNIYNGAADLYCYFYEQATNLLKPQGYLGFITSNKWMRASYGQGLRDYLFANTKIINFIDLGGQKVFDNASVDCNMIVYQKKPASRQMVSKGNINNEDNIYNVSNVGNQYNADNVSNINNEDNFDDYFFKASTNLISYRLFHIKNLDPKCFNITATDIDRQIKAKMEQIGTPLKDWGVKINAGIKTGCNEAFIINTKTKQELCSKDPKCQDIIKPILRGRDIDRYGYEWAGLWVIFIRRNSLNQFKLELKNIKEQDTKPQNSLQEQGSPASPPMPAKAGRRGEPSESANKASPDDEDSMLLKQIYPSIYEHLIKYYNQLEKRSGKQNWLEFQADDKSHELQYSIVWQEITDEPCFTIDYDNYNLLNTCYRIDNCNCKLYLLTILNSKIVNFFISQISSTLGKSGKRWTPQYIEKLPIPTIPQDAQKPFEEKAEAMLKLNKELKTHSTQMVEFLVDKFLPYHKPKSKKQALEEFEALKTDTDYNKSIPEINRVANHNNSLAKKLNKDMQETLGEEDIYKLKSKLSKWYEAGFNLASVFEALQKFNITVPSKEQFAFSPEFNDTFNTKAKECRDLQTQITSLDKEIDAMVYHLYGLTEEEVEIVENNNN